MRLRLPGLFFLLVSLFVGIFVLTQPAASQNFIEPGNDAPDGAIATPLNASDSAQLKAGLLVIGDGNDRFCLNGDANLGVTLDQIAAADTTNCISTWADVSNSLVSRFVIRSQSGITGNQLLPANYPKQSGYARIQSTGTDQAYSVIATAPPICVENSAAGFIQCGTGDFGQVFCFCANNGSGCETNADCAVPGAPTIPAATVGLYASDGGITNNDAGVLGGRVSIFGGQYVLGSPQLGRICLNGTGGTNCVTSWDQAEGGIYSLVKLQGYSIGAGPNPSEKQLGSAGINTAFGVINGVSHSSAILAGDPNAIGSVGCGAQPCICGDGHCAASFENSTSCPIDCQQINPVANVQISAEFNTVNVSVTPPASPSAGHVLVARTQSGTSNFTPQSGRKYEASMTLGDARIAYAADSVGASPVMAQDTNVSAGLYYYNVYFGNRFPRYSSVSANSVDFVPLTVTLIGPNSVGGFGGQTNDFFCIGPSSPCTNRLVLEKRGVTETVDAFTSQGYAINWSGACSGTGTCTILMNGPKSLTGTLTASGGGGGGILEP